MILKYFATPPNAGDTYNLDYLRFFLEKFNYASSSYSELSGSIMFCGSLIDYLPEDGLCCGLGLIHPGRLPKKPLQQVISVRGPLTLHQCAATLPRKRLLMGDPGVLAGEVFSRELEGVVSDSLLDGVIPHYVDKPHAWKLQSRQPVSVIDIQAPAVEVLKAIKRCRHVYSSSLHGIIFAHAVGVPATWVEFSDEVVGQGFKFYDYYLSLGIHASEVARNRVSDACDVASLDTSHALPATDAIKKDALYALYCCAELLVKLHRDQAM